jgi:hypothetical protein
MIHIMKMIIMRKSYMIILLMMLVCSLSLSSVNVHDDNTFTDNVSP